MATAAAKPESYVQADPDVRLMLEVQSDNAAAFEELVSRYQQRLLSVFQLLVVDKDLSEDLTQEVFLRVYRARKKYRPKAKFCTWLFTIANNMASNVRRSQKRRERVQYSDAWDAGQVTVPSGLMPARRLEKVEQIEHVRHAIGTLNERQRLALQLCKFEGMSYAEIGLVMGTTPKAIKSLLARARENLRTALAPYIRDGSGLPA